MTRARVQQIAIEATRRVRYSAEKRKLIDGLEGGGFHPEGLGTCGVVVRVEAEVVR